MRMTPWIAALSVLGVAGPVGAQSLAARVSQSPDGVVRMQVDSRAGVCGDGRDLIGYRNAVFSRTFQSVGGRWNASGCVPGPLRISLTVAEGAVRQLRTQVGGAWPNTDARITDLAVVSPGEASAYFFSLVPRLERGEAKDRLLIPAVLADGPPVIQPLLALARDTDRAESTRRAAVQWLGIVGDASVIPALVRFAREEEGNDQTGKKSIGSSAMAALGTLEGDIGVPALIELTGSGSVGSRRNAIFWLGQTRDPRALAHLKDLYSRVDSESLREAVIQGLSQDESDGGRWLLARALDEKESRRLRKSALFWAGQGEGAPTSELVRAYRELRDVELREHAIFVLSQRKDDTATDELIRIAREDRDTNLRGKALFWLAQDDDPRVRQLIADLILR